MSAHVMISCVQFVNMTVGAFLAWVLLNGCRRCKGLVICVIALALSYGTAVFLMGLDWRQSVSGCPECRAKFVGDMWRTGVRPERPR